MMLEGMKVVEMASIAAGPAASGMLCEWGADVVKIEPLEGEAGRHTLTGLGVTDLEVNPEFDLHNRGKRSIALKLNTPEAHAIVLDLVRKADVFVTNMQPQKLEKRRIDWPDLRAVNPRLIYANVTGYGREGPDRELKGIDHAAFWSRSGVAALMTPKGAEPMPIRMALGDRVTSLALLSGILAAYIEAQRTGRGKLIDVSLLRTGIFAAGTDIGLQITRGRVGSNKKRHENVNPYNSFYPTKDGQWMAVNLGRAESVSAALGHPELDTDPRFKDPATRRAQNGEVVDVLDAIFRERTLAEWCERFRNYDFVWAPVQSAADVIKDPQAEASGAFVQVPRRDGKGTYRGVATPVGFTNPDGTPDGMPRGPGPDIGEHADAILKSIGYDTAKIAALRAKGVIV